MIENLQCKPRKEGKLTRNPTYQGRLSTSTSNILGIPKRQCDSTDQGLQG